MRPTAHPRSARVRAGLLLVLSAALAAACGDPGPGTPPRPADAASLDPEVAELIERSVAAVELAPRDAEAWGTLGVAYHANDLFAEARTCYEQALALREDEPRWWYHLARVRDQLGDPDGALDAMGRSIELDGTYVPARWRRGAWRLDRGDLDGAEADLGRAVELAPDDAQASLELARLLIERDKPIEAIARVRPVLATDPDDPFAHLLMANALRATGRAEQAESHLRRSAGQRFVRHDPWATEVLRHRVGFDARLGMASLYLKDGDVDAARTMLEALFRQRPDDPRVTTKLAQSYLVRGRVEEALQFLGPATARHPDVASLQLELGSALHMAGRSDEGLEHLARAVELEPDLAVAHYRRGRILLGRDGIEEACAALERAAALEPDDANYLTGHGECLGRLGRWPEAAERYAAAVRLDADDPELLVRLGHAALRSGRPEVAERSLERALELGPRRPEDVRALLEQVRSARAARDAGPEAG